MTVGGSPSWERGDVRSWAEALVRGRGLRRWRGVLVSPWQATDGNGYPKIVGGTASLDWPAMAVSLRNTVTVPWLARCRSWICPGCRSMSMRGSASSKNLHVGKVALQDWDDALAAVDANAHQFRQ